MSTKIYDAFRVKRDVNLTSLLSMFKEITIGCISKDTSYLEKIHRAVILKAKEDYSIYNILKDHTDDTSLLNPFRSGHEVFSNYKEKKESFNFTFYVEDVFSSLSHNDNSNIVRRILQDVIPDFTVSIKMDDDYYYLKFFANGYFRTILYNIIKVFPQLEDFHYQNQGDVPKNITEDEYTFRSKKWDELLNDKYNFLDFLQYDIFTIHSLIDLLSKYHYTGEDLYQHLSYKFDNWSFIKN